MICSPSSRSTARSSMSSYPETKGGWIRLEYVCYRCLWLGLCRFEKGRWEICEEFGQTSHPIFGKLSINATMTLSMRKLLFILSQIKKHFFSTKYKKYKYIREIFLKFYITYSIGSMFRNWDLEMQREGLLWMPLVSIFIRGYMANIR